MRSTRVAAVGVVALLFFFSRGILASQTLRLSVGGDIKPPVKMHDVRPAYPKEALDKGIGGTVLLDIVIATDGTVLDATVAQGVDPFLDDAAVGAVSEWKYAPTKVNGDPVELAMTVE